MPTFDGAGGRIYYRDWVPEHAIGGMVFGHGFGEHSGLFHRFAFRLNALGIRVWGIDALGHGLSGGKRGEPAVADLATNVRTLTEIARAAAPGLPLVVAGHSMGSIAAALALVQDPGIYRAAVLTGAPIEGFDFSVLDVLDDVVMSRDPFYLDQLENDPLEAWTRDAPPPGRAALDADKQIWPALGDLDTPILFVNGENDPIAPPAMGARAAARCRDAQAVEIDGGCHDILNDSPHAAVTDLIGEFVLNVLRTNGSSAEVGAMAPTSALDFVG